MHFLKWPRPFASSCNLTPSVCRSMTRQVTLFPFIRWILIGLTISPGQRCRFINRYLGPHSVEETPLFLPWTIFRRLTLPPFDTHWSEVFVPPVRFPLFMVR